MHAGRFDVGNAVEAMHLNADWAMELKGTTIPSTSDHLHYTVREPFGVVGRIIAYNHPLMFATRAATPLIAGNAVIVKTPDQAPLSGLRLAELAAEVLPPGAADDPRRLRPRRRRRACRAIPAIRRIAFTGSVRTGLAIQGAAAASGVVKSISLELGGKNPLHRLPRRRPRGGRALGDDRHEPHDDRAASPAARRRGSWCTSRWPARSSTACARRSRR